MLFFSLLFVCYFIFHVVLLLVIRLCSLEVFVYDPDPWVVDENYILAFWSMRKSFGMRVFYYQVKG
jgi:hypothetical protein